MLSFRTRRKALNLCSVQQVNQFAREKNLGHGDQVLAVGRKIGAYSGGKGCGGR